MPFAADAYLPVFRAGAAPALLLDAELVVVDANDTYLRTVGATRPAIVGRYVFEAFPGSPDDPRAPQTVEASMRRALESGRPDRLPLVQYDVSAQERWWTLVNVPVRDEHGDVRWLLHVVEDVTEVVRERRHHEGDRAAVQGLQARTEALEQDLWARSRELAAMATAEAVASRRLTGLAEAALELAGAETLEDLTDTIVGRGLVALGADGGVVAVRDDLSGALRLTLTESLAQHVDAAELPLDGPLPASVAARTGAVVLLRDPAAGAAFAPEMEEVHAVTGRAAWAALPLRIGDRLLGSLTASWDEPQAFDAADVELMAAFAAQCAQALDRLLVRQAERQTASVTRRLAEALQRSLLTAPPQPDHLQLAVRYRPAAAEAAVGGDWYDAFLVSGTVSLVIGDVGGHDQDAAAAMGQVRNLLRGVSHVKGAPPAEVLSALDAALAELAVGALATAVLAQVEQDAELSAQGLRRLRWSNAGHPPPLLLEPGGRATLLVTEPDLLLGLDPDSGRSDHVHVLQPGSTVLLYTDGLVERRGASLDEGLAWLRATAGRLAGRTLDELCDALLADVGHELEDDVALLAVRAHPEDRARPPEAGPQVVPGYPARDG